MASKSIVCWQWGGAGRDFRPEHVNVLQRMFARHLPEPHRFICIADDTEGFDSAVEVIPTPPEAKALAHLRTPEGGRFPSCYRRLWMFSDEARCLGERVMLVDIDLLLTDDVSPLFAQTDDFVGWKPRASWGHNNRRIGGGLYLLTPGTRTQVWTGFNGAGSIAQARKAGYRGSDQAWMSYKLQGCTVLPPDCGVISIRDIDNGETLPPPGTRMVQHNGTVKPWTSKVEWVRDLWR